MLSVIMCTYNGSDTIGRTLEAFCQLQPPTGGWKLVIVDNASTDDAPTIIRQFSTRLPLTMVRETRPGQTHAQNTGIGYVEGDLAIFTDDDVLPDTGWLVEWRRVADRFPEIEIFGGTVIPQYEQYPPDFIARSGWINMLYAATDTTLGEGLVSSKAATIYGPNMAFRPSLLLDGHRFDNRLMAGPSSLMGNETDFVDRAIAKGAKVGFAPTARVHHIVNGTQISWRWILQRFYRHGRTLYFLEGAGKDVHLPKINGIPRYLIRRLAERIILLPLILIMLNKGRLMAHLRLIAYDMGALHQARRMP